MPSKRAVLVAALVSHASASKCSTDGSDYSYTESIDGNTRTVVMNGCPNHAWYQLNPNYPVNEMTTRTIPASPTYVGAAADTSTSSASIDLSQQGGDTGVLFNGAWVFSPYGGPQYGKVTDHASSATYAEGDSFDQCGCHGSSTTKTSYHCHVPPSCLLKQLGQNDWAHSPQIGWAYDGFPIYGPRGKGGTMMQTCTQTGGTYGIDQCTDDCGGYYDDDSFIDGFVYRYYMQGTYGDGTSNVAPACPSPTGDYYPNSPVCYRGCCPSGVTCHNSIPACTGNNEIPGTTSTYVPDTWFAAGLPANTEAATCSSIECSETCSSSEWAKTPVCGRFTTTCTVSSSPSPSDDSSSSPSPSDSFSPAPSDDSSSPSPSDSFSPAPGSDNGSDQGSPGSDQGSDQGSPGSDQGSDQGSPGSDQGSPGSDQGSDHGSDHGGDKCCGDLIGYCARSKEMCESADCAMSTWTCGDDKGSDHGSDHGSKPCVKVLRSKIEAIEAMGWRVRTCEEKRRRRRLQGLNPGPPCKKFKKQEVPTFHI